MDIVNTEQKEFSGELNCPTTSLDRILDKESEFGLDVTIKALKNALVCMYPALSVFYASGFAHNAFVRGKRLGTSVTANQYEAIKNGSFEDLYLGDYWEIDGNKWRITAFDYWLGKGPSSDVTFKHHAVIVPDKSLLSTQINSVDTADGSYGGSDFRTGNNGNTGLSDAKTIINNAFGADHILTHKNFFLNHIDNRGIGSSGAWYDSSVELMNVYQLVGSGVRIPTWMGYGNTPAPYINTVDNTIFPLFLYAPQFLNVIALDGSRGVYWLRDSMGYPFLTFTYDGTITYENSTHSNNIRPCFGLYSE